MPTSSRGNDSRGFSLFELLVVMVMIALAFAIVMPSFSRGMKGLELEASGRDLVTRMKQARSKAIAEQRVFRVIVSPDENSPRNEAVNHYQLTDEFEQELKRFVLPPGLSIRLPEQEFPLKVSFYPNGRSSGGALALENDQGRRIEIAVDPITGFARVGSPDHGQ